MAWIVASDRSDIQRVASALSSEFDVSRTSELQAAAPSELDAADLPELVVIYCKRADEALAFVDSLRARVDASTLPILAIVDPDDAAGIVALCRAGVSDVLVQPCEPEELLMRARSRVDVCRRVEQLTLELEDCKRGLRSLTDNAPDVIARFDRDLHHMFVSKAVERLTGVPVERYLGARSQDMGHPAEFAARWDAAVRAVFDERAPRTIELRYDGAGGSRYFEARLVPELGTNGEVESVLSIARDLTDRVIAARALEASERRYRATFDHAAIGIGHVGPDGRWMHVNTRLCEITGYPKDELLSKSWPDLAHSDNVDSDRERMAALFERRLSSDSWETRCVRKNGSVIWVSLTASVVCTTAGEPHYLVEMLEDIEARKQAELAMRQSEALFRSIGEDIPFGVWLADAEGRLQIASESFCQLIGRSAAELADFDRFDSLTPEQADKGRSRWREQLRTGESWEHELRLRDPKGVDRIILSRGHPVRDSTGKLSSWVGINLDVTERMRAEQAMREAARQKDRFLATLGHELRNPIAAIRSATDVLRLTIPSEPRLKRPLDVLDRQTAHIGRLIDDLLDVSRIIRGKTLVMRTTIDLAKVVRDALDDHRARLLNRPKPDQLNLQVELDEGPVWILGDAVRLAQVVDNLLSNAVKYTDGPGVVRIELSATRNHAILRVRDNGLGIEREFLDRLFEPFEQASDGEEGFRGGLGLGLSITKGIVEQHGGTIEALSEGRGRGSEFVVRLPRLHVG